MSPEAHEMLELLLDSAEAFLKESHSLDRLRISRYDCGPAVDSRLWTKMAELGWLGMGLPEALGGLGLPLECSAGLSEKFGRALLPEPFIASAIMPAALLATCSPGETRDSLAARLIGGDAILTLAWQERAGTLEPGPIGTELERGVIDGTKRFVPFALDGATLLVLAQEAGEPMIVAVDGQAAGVNATFHRCGDGSRVADIAFCEARITGEPLVRGEPALAALQAALDAGTVAASAHLTGLARRALDLSIEYLRTRQQFGHPIGSFQALRHAAVDLHLKVQLAEASWRHAVRRLDAAPGTPATRAAISAAKSAGNRAARATGEKGVQVFGAMGFTDEADIGLYLRASLHLAGWLGTETAHNRRFHATAGLEAVA